MKRKYSLKNQKILKGEIMLSFSELSLFMALMNLALFYQLIHKNKDGKEIEYSLFNMKIEDMQKLSFYSQCVAFFTIMFIVGIFLPI